MSDLRLGIAQLTSIDDVKSNLQVVERLFREAAQDKADLVVFPENSLFFRLKAGTSLQGPRLGGPELSSLQNLVDHSGSKLMLTTALAVDSQKFSNSTLLIEPFCAPRIVYSKIHLFDVDVPGAPPVRESDHFQPGEEPKVIEINGWKIGLSICYDVRFAELFSHYASAVDLILVPSAFLVPTGQAHWHVLLRARAIESQAYLAAPAQAGSHGLGADQRQTYGHSLLVDPWGRVLADLSGGPQVKVFDLSRKAIEDVRSQIPMSHHRRL